MTPAAWWALAAIALRLALAWAVRDAGVFADMEQYHARAVHLLEHGTLPDALRGPGYPLALAAAYAVGGVRFGVARVLHALAGGALALVAAALARRAGAGRRAWVAAAVVAVYPGLVLSSVYLMPDGWYALWSLAAIVVAAEVHAVPATARRPAVRSLLAGACAGAAILTRSVGVAVLPSLAAALAWGPAGRGRRRSAATRVAAAAVACLLVLAPWLVFTTRVAGGPLLDATSGMNLLLGNHPGATGRLVIEQGPPLEAEHVAGAASVADASARAMRAGLRWAAGHPTDWARLAVKKLGYLFGLEGREHAWLYSSGYFGPRPPGIVRGWGLALILGFPLLAIGAAAGIAAAAPWRTPAGAASLLFVVATAALHVISFGESRFHLPLVPVFAAWAAVAANPDGRRWSLPGLVTASLVVVLLMWGWSTQLPELRDRVDLLARPDGWQHPLPY